MPRRERRGLALILVMTVILALSIIATPFVLSMILQEKTATAARYESQAYYGSDGAKNYAIWRLMYGVDPVERSLSNPGDARYTYDTLAEQEIFLTDDYLQGANVLNPRGSIWGINVQDEQGKLNVMSAPPGTVVRLRQLVGERAVSHKDYLTQYSGRDATWIYPQRIRGIGTFRLPDGSTLPGIAVDSAVHFAPRSRVRVSKPNLPSREARVASNYLLGAPPGGTGGHAIETDPPVPPGYADGIIEVEQRHPVNPNTARRETMAAVFEGLNLTGVQGSMVDATAAWQLAQMVAGKNTRRIEDFLFQVAQSPLAPQQKLSVAINAVAPSFFLFSGSGTVPLCFRSYDVYTLEALASMNNPAGVEVAGRGFREVASVSPPSPLQRSVQSQWDLDSTLAAAMAVSSLLQQVGMRPETLNGYPFGSRFITFPNLYIPLTPDERGQPHQPSDTTLGAPTTVYAQPQPSRDFRGETAYRNELQRREHFDTYLEGKKLQGGSLDPLDWRKVYSGQTAQSLGMMDVPSGGLEMWLRFDQGGNPIPLFDVNEGLPNQPCTNRHRLRIENAELIQTISDGTIGNDYRPPPPVPLLPTQQMVQELYKIDNGSAETRHPLNPVPETWFHVGAYWKGTRHGQSLVLVDGFAYPSQQDPKFAVRHVDPQGNPMNNTLGAGMSPTSTSMNLAGQRGWVPNIPFALLVGDEVVVYTSGAAQRGMRGTAAGNHPTGAPVQIFGYASKIVNGSVTFWAQSSEPVRVSYPQLTRGGAMVKFDFGMDPQATVAGDKQDPNTMQWYLDIPSAVIPVNSANIMEFPDQGYIIIQEEVIFYTGRSLGGVNGRGNAKFTGCARAQHGKPAVRHNEGQEIEMWGVPVDNHNDFMQQAVIQVGDEWIGPVQKDGRPDFWIPFPTMTSGGNFETLQGNRRGRRTRRGALWTMPAAHNRSEKVTPTFMAREMDPNITRYNMGVHAQPGIPPLRIPDAQDMVTVTDGMNNKEQAIVRRGVWEQPNEQRQIYSNNVVYNFQPNNAQVVAFYDAVRNDYPAGDPFARVLKFPSGELMSRAFLEPQDPKFTIGPLNATVDEVKFFGEPKGHLAFAQPVSDTEKKLVVLVGIGPGQAEGDRLPENGGVIRAGDELIGYGHLTRQPQGNNVTQYRLDGVIVRGWLNTTAQAHAGGESVMALPYIPVAAMASDLGPGDREIRLNQWPSCQTQGNNGPPRDYTQGYVLVENELIGFEWVEGGYVLGLPPAQDGTGLFRGRFGTAPTAHKADTALVYGLPWRFWDTYKAQEFDSRMVYYQWSTKMDLAKWDDVTWVQEVPQNDPNIVVHALARVDGRGEFWDPPAVSDKTLLYMNAPGQTTLRVDRVGFMQDAGQFDLRFYVEYKRESFDATQPWGFHSWKRAPKIRDIKVEYDRPTQVLYHEDR